MRRLNTYERRVKVEAKHYLDAQREGVIVFPHMHGERVRTQWCPHHEEEEAMLYCIACDFSWCPFFYGIFCPRCGGQRSEEKST